MFGGDQNPFVYESERHGNPLFTMIQAIVIALVINVTIYFLFVIPSQVDGQSMYSTLENQELLFANKIPTWLGTTDFGKQINMDYKRGDIIIFEYNNMLLVKRIIGIEGDKVKVENGEVFVNGKQLTETYLRAGIKSYLPSAEYSNLVEGQESVVPKDSFFVMGDNRPASKDSRYSDVGFIKRDKMKGIVFLRFWPLDKFGIINGAQYN